MSDLFKQINSICKKERLEKSYIDECYVGSFILIKWIASIKCEESLQLSIMELLNNINYYIFESNWDAYLFLYHSIPKLNSPNFEYIKKSDSKKQKEKEISDREKSYIDFLSEALEISKREAKYILDNKFFDENQISMIHKPKIKK